MHPVTIEDSRVEKRGTQKAEKRKEADKNSHAMIRSPMGQKNEHPKITFCKPLYAPKRASCLSCLTRSSLMTFCSRNWLSISSPESDDLDHTYGESFGIHSILDQ
jgi:hypothetical protein